MTEDFQPYVMPIYDVKSSPLKTHSNIFSYCVSKLGLTVNDSTTTEEISLQLAKTEPDLSANAKDTFLRRYCETDNTGNPIETPGDVFRRVGRMLSDVEKKYGATTHQCIEWHILMSSVITSKLFMPAGRTLANEDKKVVPNCIVLEIEDSIDSIAEVLKNSIILQKHGSGLGFPLHKMRPAGDWAAGSRSHASGPVSFLHMYNGAFGVIKQQGRNGANMAVMSVDHPDILEFVHCKEREGDIVNFNISVGLVDDFMVRVATGDKEPYMARFKGIKRAPHRVKRNQRRHYQGHTDVVMTAEEMFKEIIATAHTNGEPGCVFLDTVNATNPLPRFGKLESCNPCGEQFLHNGDVCNLGSINVGQFVTEDGVFMEDAYRECCRLAVRALDNVIDTYGIPVDLVRDVSKANRRVGLGLMGLADALVHLRLPYDSCEGREAAANFMRIMKEETMKESMRLAKEKGVFINFSLSIHVGKAHVRNCALTSNAPTGSISMISDASSGIEPNFALVFEKKNIMGQNKVFYYTVRGLDKALKECGCYTPEILKEIHKTGTMQHIRKIPKNIRAVFRCSGDMCAADHVLMQAALQTYTDNAISKTVNFPNDATESDVFNVYILAWLLDCKGCTVYRSGSRNEEVLTLSTKDGTTTEKAAPLDFSDMETYDPLESAITPNDIVKAITKSTNARKELEDLSLFMETKLRSLLKVHSDVVCGENGLKRAIQIANAVLSTCRNARRIALVTNPTPVHTATPESVSPSTSSEEDESGGEDRRSPLLTESCDESVSPPRLKSPAKWEAACPECGEARLAFEEGCEKCYSCGWGKCNTAPLKRPTPAPVVAVGPGVSRETYIV